MRPWRLAAVVAALLAVAGGCGVRTGSVLDLGGSPMSDRVCGLSISWETERRDRDSPLPTIMECMMPMRSGRSWCIMCTDDVHIHWMVIMARTMLGLDGQALKAAQARLGTSTTVQTVNEALPRAAAPPSQESSARAVIASLAGSEIDNPEIMAEAWRLFEVGGDQSAPAG